ncbi:unnamed protein product [Laminaria digitata]
MVEPVDEWRVHEQSNKEKRSQGQGKHHAEKADPVASSSYLVKFYMEQLSGVIDAADSVLLVRRKNNICCFAYRRVWVSHSRRVTPRYEQLVVPTKHN